MGSGKGSHGKKLLPLLPFGPGGVQSLPSTLLSQIFILWY